MDVLSGFGRYCYAIALIAFGLRQIVCPSFVRLVPGLPSWLPWPAAWAVLSGVILVSVGWAILIGRRMQLAAMVAGTLFLFLFVFLHVPQIIGNPLAGFVWTNPCKTLALLGAALCLTEHRIDSAGVSFAVIRLAKKLRPLSWIFLGVFLVVCGVQHFVYAGFVDTLVPAWIPPGPRFWTCFSGIALVVGGLGLALPKTARLAALLVGIMIFLWVILLHIPLTVEKKNLFEFDGVLEALALSGAAFMLVGRRKTTG